MTLPKKKKKKKWLCLISREAGKWSLYPGPLSHLISDLLDVSRIQPLLTIFPTCTMDQATIILLWMTATASNQLPCFYSCPPPWNLHSTQNDSFRSKIFSFFTQNSPAAGETLQDKIPVSCDLPPLPSPTPASLAPLLPCCPLAGRHTVVGCFFTGHSFSLEVPLTQIFMWLLSSLPLKLCSKVTFS